MERKGVDCAVIAVLSAEEKLLLCRRGKPPYQGLFDLVGGKVEPGEDALACAYRELFEETGIPRGAITLHPLLAIHYCQTGATVHVFSGRLMKETALVEECNPLFWSGLEHDFSDTSIYSGDGYLVPVLAELKKHWRILQ